MNRGIALAGLALALAACVTPRPPTPTPPLPGELDACEAYCAVRVRLRCEDNTGSPGADDVDGTADDVPCEQVCADMMAGGTYQADRACLDDVATCGAAEACMFDGARP